MPLTIVKASAYSQLHVCMWSTCVADCSAMGRCLEAEAQWNVCMLRYSGN